MKYFWFSKTYFSELLRKVQGGAVVNISKNGKKVAVLQAANNVQNKVISVISDMIGYTVGQINITVADVVMP